MSDPAVPDPVPPPAPVPIVIPLPAYIFQATCAIGSSLRSSFLVSLDEITSPLGWQRVSAQVFQKKIEVATADLAAAEEEFLTALHSCKDAHPFAGFCRVKFDSSNVLVQE